MRKVSAFLLVGAMMLLTACGGGGQTPASNESNELKDVSLRLDWLLGSEHAPYFVAQEKGYFEEEGLKVSVREGEGSSVSVKLVGNGDDTFGVVAAGTVLISVEQGLPVQTVATIFQDTPTAVIYPKQKPIDSIEDLEGKNLGVLIKSVTFNEWQAVAKINGFDREKVRELAMDRSIVQPMLAGKTDAGIAWFINDGVQLRVEGQDTGFLKFSDLGLNVPSSTIVANTQTIEENPEVVEGFVRAVLRGWEFTQANPDEAFDIFMKHAPEVDEEYNRTKLPLLLELIDSDEALGHSSNETWGNLKELYMDFDLLKQGIDLNQVYTNKFIAQ